MTDLYCSISCTCHDCIHMDNLLLGPVDADHTIAFEQIRARQDAGMFPHTHQVAA